MTRIIIRPEDVVKILGVNIVTARKKIRAIKDCLSTKGKKIQYVTISQFAKEYNLPVEEVMRVIED